ncbi:MAG: ribosome maturation factor RimP [Candidatus Rokubacteria bacterium]|nr:ribosome maturation factor RimP [Candidatus Rokubacteria bacterium]
MSEEDRIARIEEVVVPVLRDHGLELVDLEWKAHGPRGVLRLFIDKPGGVGIKDCERVSREIGDVLDVSGLIEERYDLEVSSPGLDRPLKTDREYRWARGKRVRCWLTEGRDLSGRLVDVNDQCLVMDVDGQRLDVARGEVRKARLEPDVPWRRQA